MRGLLLKKAFLQHQSWLCHLCLVGNWCVGRRHKRRDVGEAFSSFIPHAMGEALSSFFCVRCYHELVEGRGSSKEFFRLEILPPPPLPRDAMYRRQGGPRKVFRFLSNNGLCGTRERQKKVFPRSFGKSLGACLPTNQPNLLSLLPPPVGHYVDEGGGGGGGCLAPSRRAEIMQVFWGGGLLAGKRREVEILPPFKRRSG